LPDEPKKDAPPASPAAKTDLSAFEEAKKALDASSTTQGLATPAGAPSESEDDELDDGWEPPEAEADAATPEAIAKRVAALGEEDEIERIARQEEAKLAERRKRQRKGKKGSLEAAASKRLAKIGAKAPVQRAIATAADADPLIDRAAKLSDWAKKNQKTVQIFAGVAVVAAAGLGLYGYLQKKHETEASVQLAKAVADERGRIGDPEKEDDPDRPKDPRPVFKNYDDRREAALMQYRSVEKQYAGTGAAILARLSEGSILLDKHDADGAASAFGDVRKSPLAQADPEVRGRSLEGLGFAYELKADTQQGDAQGSTLDEANKAFRELENTDVKGFKELGMYHQARIFEKKGDKAKAVELLKSLHERVTAPGENHPFVYLENVAEDRLRALDPTALPPKPAGRLGGPGGNQMSEAQMKKLIEQMQHQQQEQQKHGGGAPPGAPPGAPK
jgi:hypothetical protein